MLLWGILGLLTAASLVALLRPLLRDGHKRDGREAFDATVFKDQLEEVDTDLARGLMNAEDADAARVEISRRLLATADRAPKQSDKTSSVARSVPSAVLCAVIVPLMALSLYTIYGSPGLPDQPRAARQQVPAEQQRVDELVARVEAKLRANPDDGAGWDVIAPVYLGLERYDDARDAFAHALRLEGETIDRLFGIGEAIRLSNKGMVTEEALSFFERAVELDPKYVPALYRLAVAMEQDGRYGDAVNAWKDILDKLPSAVAWRQDAKRRLAAAEARRDGKPVPTETFSSSEGPTRAQIEAAKNMTPQQRQTMIKNMVGRLAARLKENGHDLLGWQRLVQAYVVLGRRSDAQAALKEARENFARNDEALSALTTLAQQMGLES